MTPAQHTFVVSSFASNYRRRSGVLSDDVWRHCILSPFEAALPKLTVNVAQVPGEPDEFMGWAASIGTTLVYCFVKKDYRGRGVGRRLLPARVDALAFATIDGHAFLRACGMRSQPRPWAVFDVLAETTDSEKRPWG